MAKNTTAFWDRIAKGYSRKPVPDKEVYQEKLERTRALFQPEMTVFEFGCGTGTTALHHAPYVKSIYATDFSQSMIDIAEKKRIAANIENVTFACKSMEELDIPNGSMDVVMGHSILHLLQNKKEVIADAYGWLKPGGAFVTSTSCIADFFKLFKLIGPIGRKLGLLPMVNVFSLGELLEDFKDAGFKIEYQWQPNKTGGVFIIARK